MDAPNANRELWQRLEAFELDDPDASLTFTRRLARENDWDQAFAQRVVEEYKRFAFLAMTAGHQVTPSDEVDQAWHLHLTYTRSYWGELCGEVLGKPLHHGPTKGGKQEGNRFEDQYERTLASYRKAFGAEPPADVWPPSEVRFGEAPDFVRVNKQRTWLLPKPWKLVDRRPLALAGAWIALAPPLAAGAAWNVFDFDGPAFLKFYAILCLLGVAAAWLCRVALRVDGPEPTGDEIADDPVAIGVLREGWVGAFHATVAGLLADGSLTHMEKRKYLRKEHRFVAARDPSREDSSFQAAVLRRARAGGDEGVLLETLASEIESHAVSIERDMSDKGFCETRQSFWSVRVAVGAILGVVLLVGAIKLAVGLAREKPIGFLVLEMAVAGVAAAILLRKPRHTRAGLALLDAKKKKHHSIIARATSPVSGLDPSQTAIAVALVGVANCQAICPDGLELAVRTTSANSGGSGCGSGDSGGCGGGGCGGCGGCG